MNWYEIAYDLFTSEPGGPRRFVQEEQQILDHIQRLANSFARSRSLHDIVLDEHTLFHLGLKKIRDKIDTFESRSDIDHEITHSFKAWMSKVCWHKWTDELNKIKRKNEYETKHYFYGDHDENQDTIEYTDPVEMDPLVIDAENRSLMRHIVRDVLKNYPEHKREAILEFRSIRKGRNGTRGFEGETAEIAANANVRPDLIRKWSSRFEIACLARYTQEKQNVESDQAASQPRSR